MQVDRLSLAYSHHTRVQKIGIRRQICPESKSHPGPIASRRVLQNIVRSMGYLPGKIESSHTLDHHAEANTKSLF